MNEDLPPWELVERVFHEVLDQPAHARWDALARFCGGDQVLHREVYSLLLADDQSPGAGIWPVVDASLASVIEDFCSETATTPTTALQPGVRVTTYEVIELIGRGGMGEVYRARDLELSREVALKVLPTSLGGHSDRLALLRNEARVLAALNAPNICAIYGLTETVNGHPVIILELIEGETLARRMEQRPVPLIEAVDIARQVARALEAAHEHGIIHLDLKPSNIKLRPDGTVKVLDFGLARHAGHLQHDEDRPGLLNGSFEVAGTAAYMSPEHARGDAIDKRSDIWAFGCVLFELFAREHPFRCDTVEATLAAVLQATPPWDKLAAGTPAAVRTLLDRCLEGDSKQRLRDIGEARIALDDLATGSKALRGAVLVKKGSERRAWHRIVASAIVMVALVTATLIWFTPYLRSPLVSAGSRAVRITIAPPTPARITNDGVGYIAISPDGTRVAYVAETSDSFQIFVRSLDQLESIPIGETHSGITGLCFSPDGQWVGFAAFGNEITLRKVFVSSGAETALARVDSLPLSAAWGADGEIVYATRNGLWQVNDAGGTALLLVRWSEPDGVRHRYLSSPDRLPGGRFVLVTIQAQDSAESQIASVDLRTGEQKIVIERGSGARYLGDGRLVYSVGHDLFAVRFDLRALATIGTPILVLSAAIESAGPVDFAIAENGTLAYVGGTVGAAPRELVWVNRDGSEHLVGAPRRLYFHPRISPDGRTLLVDTWDEQVDTWNWDFVGKSMTRVTFGRGRDIAPVWTPDGRRMVFQSNSEGPLDLFWTAADGSGSPERLTHSAEVLLPTSFSPDGSQLMVTRFAPTAPPMLMAFPVSTRGPLQPLLAPGRFGMFHGEVSPDGKWIAYVSRESSRPEVQVRPFPLVTAGRWQVSLQGGGQPAWARDSRELFYRDSTGALMGVRVAGTSGWRPSAPTKVVKSGYFFEAENAVRTYDVAPDGARFLMIKEVQGDRLDPAYVVVVENWLQEFNRMSSQR